MLFIQDARIYKMLYDIVNDNIQILLDKRLYKLEDIINANNSIADKCSMKIDENDKAYIVNIVSDIVPEEIYEKDYLFIVLS